MTKRHTEPLGKTWPTLGLSLCALCAATLSACGGSGDKLEPTANPIVAGTITYDYVPTSTTKGEDGTLQGGLVYSKTEKRPVRRALVELVSEDGASILGRTATDDLGAYSIPVQPGKKAYVRVTAQASELTANVPDYAISIRDNTAPEYKNASGAAPLYSMRGSLFTTTNTGVKLDLNAGSGWTGASYGAPRTAAPFAILDQMVRASQKLHRAAPEVALPALNVFWSVNNRPTSGDTNLGFIDSSHWDSRDATRGVYVLGAEDVDTDEYDASVIVHEFGHYVESSVSRSDSIGGSHSMGDGLDMRVAFGEAFGNAFSSIMRDTPVYTDTDGPGQTQLGVNMRLDEVESGARPTWFDESAVGHFLYSASQSPDIGWAPLYRTMLTGEKTTPALTSVFSFAAALRPGLSDAGKRRLDQLLVAVAVQPGDQLDSWGTKTMSRDDTNEASAAIFPIYLPLTLENTVSACMTSQFGFGNKLGNFRHLRVTIPAAGKYRFTFVPQTGQGDENKLELGAYVLGQTLTALEETDTSVTYEFPAAGDYAVDVVAQADLDQNGTRGVAPHCASVSLQSLNQ